MYAELELNLYCIKNILNLWFVLSLVLNFQVTNKQFSFLMILSVYHRSDQHRSVCNSYNAKLASMKMKHVQLENCTVYSVQFYRNMYSSFNTVRFDTSDAHDKYLLYMQFVVWYCKGSSIVPLLEYAINSPFQGLPDLNDYFTNSDEKIFIDLRHGKSYTGELEKINRDDSDLTITVTLKEATTKKLRLCVTGHYQGEYLYLLSNKGLLMNYREYGVNKPNSIALAT